MSMSMELLVVEVAVAAGIMLLMAPVLAAIVMVPILLTAAPDCMSITCQRSCERQMPPKSTYEPLRESVMSGGADLALSLF